MGSCKTRGNNTGEKYFFNEVLDAIHGGGHIGGNVDLNAFMEQRVSLICSLKNIDSSSNYKVELIIYLDTKSKASIPAGFTEDKSKDTSNAINLEKFFAITYFFERQQLLDFRIYKSSPIETIQTSHGCIMVS